MGVLTVLYRLERDKGDSEANMGANAWSFPTEGTEIMVLAFLINPKYERPLKKPPRRWIWYRYRALHVKRSQKWLYRGRQWIKDAKSNEVSTDSITKDR